MKLAIEVSRLTKSFGQQVVVKDLDFSLQSGSLVAFLGPNGAGKSTTIKLLLGLRSPDSGEVRVLGGHPRSLAVRRRIGYVSQDLNFPSHLKVGEILRWVRGHYPQAANLAELIERFEVQGLWRRGLGGLSGGERRRVALICAFLGQPDLVILDEPSTGLDIDARKQLYSSLRDFRHQGGTVLLCTHDLGEAQKVADEVLLMDRGRLLFSGPLPAILENINLKKVIFELNGTTHEILTEDSDQAIRKIVRENSDFQNLRVATATLEEAFERLREKK